MRPSSPSSHELLPAHEKPAEEPTDNGILSSFTIEKAKGAASGFSAGKLLASLLEGLKPEIFKRRHGNRRPIHNTAWLDGLRGWAAFIVCFVHLSVYTHTKIEGCYAYDLKPGEEKKITPANWVFFRMFWSGGHLAVMVFFTISGYVLTKKLISLLHEGRRDDFLDSVISSIVRRPVRLFFPVACSTLASAVVWHVTGLWVPWPAVKSNIFAEIWNWAGDFFQFAYFFRNGMLFSNYNIHTWTIPVELRGSLFVFLWLFAFHRISHTARILLTLGMAIYLVVCTTGAWYAAFFAGMLTCELDLLAAENSVVDVRLPWDNFRRWLNKNAFFRQYLLHIMLLAGIYLGSQPSGDTEKKDVVLGECPGWNTLSHLIPPQYNDAGADRTHRWYYLFWASWLLLASIKEIAWVRRFFETPFSQYLGKISFALYLIHGPMILLYSERLFYLTGVKKPAWPDEITHFTDIYNKWHDASWWPFPDQGPPGLEPPFLVCCALSIPVFLYVAELGTRFFDVPSVHFSRWVYIKIKNM